jgi:hypothetical protein
MLLATAMRWWDGMSRTFPFHAAQNSSSRKYGGRADALENQMARMTEKEWQQFAAAKNLDPATGQQIVDLDLYIEPESEMTLDTWTMQERLGMHKRPPDPPKHWRWGDEALTAALIPVGLGYIAMLCTAAYFVARLFGG